MSTWKKKRWEVCSNGCWEWLLARNKEGYGVVSKNGADGKQKQRHAHRVVWEQRRGPIQQGFSVHHRCGNRGCVNPEHLEPMTEEEHRKAHGREKLNKEKVIGIRFLNRIGFGYGRLGKMFGVRESHIRDVVKRKYWKEV